MLERPGKLVALGVGIDKIEKIEIALRVAHNAVEIVDLKQTQIAMVILDAFLLQLGALFRREIIALAFGFGACGAKLMVSQKRFATMRPHSIGPAGQFHLQHPEIDSEL